MEQLHLLFDYVGAPALVLLFFLFFLLETRRELRERKADRKRRFFLNNFLAIPSFALLRFLFLPAMVLLASWNTSWEFGINYWLDLAPWAEFVIAILILDYGTYLWHILNHRVGLLWRFHIVHHIDIDLDVTTALRFHFGELIGSVFFRGLFVLLSGASVTAVIVFEILFEAATLFHHSNMRLPFGFERALNFILVTPRMHGIHHSDVAHELDSNYGVVFSIWDRIHRTACLSVKQKLVGIGIPAYHKEMEQTLPMLLLLPFRKLRPMGLRDDRPEKLQGKKDVLEP